MYRVIRLVVLYTKLFKKNKKFFKLDAIHPTVKFLNFFYNPITNIYYYLIRGGESRTFSTSKVSL